MLWSRARHTQHAARIFPAPANGHEAQRGSPDRLDLQTGTTVIDLVIEPGPSGSEQPRVDFLVRADNQDELRRTAGRIRRAQPGADIELISSEHDPGVIRRWETAARCALRPVRGDIFEVGGESPDAVLNNAITHARPAADERFLVRQITRPAETRESERIRNLSPDPASESTRARHASSTARALRSAELPIPLVVVAALAAGVSMAFYRWGTAETLGVALAATPALVGLGLVLGLVASWWAGPQPRPLPKEVTTAKLTGVPLEVSVSIIGVGAPETNHADLRRKTRALGKGIALLAGSDVEIHEDFRRQTFNDLGIRRGERMVLNEQEVAQLFPLPLPLPSGYGVARATAPRIEPDPKHAQTGIRIGISDAGSTREVRMPLGRSGQHMLVVGQTGRGKTNFLARLVAGLMGGQSLHARPPLTIVIDPLGSLARAVIEEVPPVDKARTAYLDASNRERLFTLNLVAPSGRDRDKQISELGKIMRLNWPEGWGDRADSVFTQVARLLWTASRTRPPAEQYTLADVPKFLRDAEFRRQVIHEADDRVLAESWEHDYGQMAGAFREQVFQPVLNKTQHFVTSRIPHHIFGTPISTVDIQKILNDCDLLVVNGAMGTLGEPQTTLITGTIINALLDVIEEQLGLPEAQRRELVIVMDEASTLAAVDSARVFAQFRQAGVAFIVATQSLARLDRIDPHLVPIIEANVDGIVAFRTGAHDAQRLVRQLGPPITEEALRSLDDYTCYARWSEGGRRPPAFSLTPDPPPEPNRERAGAIAKASAERYGVPLAAVS